MPTETPLTDLDAERFVSLSTFRRSGVAVPTAVWIARDGDAMVVTTGAESGKVKRVRNNPRVELTPCSRSGKVAPGAVSVAGTAEIIADPAERDRLTDLVRAKYGIEFKIVMGIESIAKSGRAERVILRITPPREN